MICILLEKVLCAVLVAVLWLCAYGGLRGVVDAAQSAVQQIEQEVDE